jgi:hypothetical protein
MVTRNSRREIEPEAPIIPHFFYRFKDGYKFFGYMPTQLGERIERGDVPMPVSLSDNGRAKGWFGRAIIAWQCEREEKAKEQKEKPPTPETPRKQRATKGDR